MSVKDDKKKEEENLPYIAIESLKESRNYLLESSSSLNMRMLSRIRI